MSRRIATAVGFLIGALAVGLAQFHAGRPQPIPEPPAERLECMSYAHPDPPFSLWEPPPVPPSVVEDELAVLSRTAGCVRLYSSMDGDKLLPVARRLGLKVILGAWLAQNEARNRAEIDKAIELANAYPDTVRTLVIGSETLLRREMSAGALKSLVEEVGARTQVPVTTAEIWSFWLRHAEMAEAVDVVTIHVLPYWDMKVPTVEDALAEAERMVAEVAARFPDKPILIGEVGWPSIGRARAAAAPGIREQARFVRGFAATAARHGWAYNVIEAFDQPWKRRYEGTVGGAWGLLAPDGTPKFALTGPVSAHPVWASHTAGALALAALVLGVSRRRLKWSLTTPRAALSAAAAPVLAALMVEQAAFSLDTVARAHEMALALLALGASAALGWLTLKALSVGQRRAALATGAALSALARPIRSLRDPATAPGWLLAAVRIAAAAEALALVLDPRYRDFAAPIFLLPALAIPLAARTHSGREDHALGLMIAALGLAALGLEDGGNAQAWAWAAVTALLALPLMLPHQSQQAKNAGRAGEQRIAEGHRDHAGQKPGQRQTPEPAGVT
ncbi:MAG TPA: hypothetical protein VEB64_07235 [Azospirillaceae bacterium]|nr:hypothetical protein [Azospirillaceae bacterium]